MAAQNVNFNDFFGNEVSPGDFVAWSGNGVMEIVQVQKMYIDKNGYRKMRVKHVAVNKTGYSISCDSRYVWDNTWDYGAGAKGASTRMILLQKI